MLGLLISIDAGVGDIPPLSLGSHFSTMLRSSYATLGTSSDEECLRHLVSCPANGRAGHRSNNPRLQTSEEALVPIPPLNDGCRLP